MLLALACTSAGADTERDSDARDEVLPEGFISHGAVACDDAVALGWTLSDQGFTAGPEGDHERESGALVHDLDGDGDRDLMVSFFQPGNAPQIDVYLWDEGFVPSPSLMGAGGFTLVDLDADGVLEVVYTTPNTVWDEGTTTTLDLGLQGVRDMAWMDVDLDGLPDLLVGTPDGAKERVYRNTGSDFEPWFTLDGANAFDLVVFDPDLDGDDDLYIANDRGLEYGGNRLWTREGVSLLDLGSDAGVVVDGMSAAPGDMDNDGDEDLLLGNASANQILENLGGGWVDVTAARTADPLTGVPDMSWNAVWLDADNDGWLDQLVARGDVLPDEPFDGTLVVMLQDPEDGTFSAQHMGSGSYRGVVPFDFNGDGVLDWLATDAVQAPELWVSNGCTGNGWLTVEAPIGARVTVESPTLTQTRVVRSDSGQGSARTPEAHLGLGDAATVNLRIELPDGRTVQGSDLRPRQRLTYSE